MEKELDLGAEGTDATPDVQDVEAVVEPKDESWIKELIAAKAELDKIKSDQAEREAQAERDKAEQEGRLDEALALEKSRYEELKKKYQADTTRLQLNAAFATADIADLRAIKLFEDEFNPETEDAAAFVARIKADPANALYFRDPKSRPIQTPPMSAARGTIDPFVPERDSETWLKSSDPKKRERAIAHHREVYRKKYGL